jgi:hypothetical protein
MLLPEAKLGSLKAASTEARVAESLIPKEPPPLPEGSAARTTADSQTAADAESRIGSSKHIELEKADNGAYTIEFDSGKTYDGKGGTVRARRSARQRSRTNSDPVKDIKHTPADNGDDAYRMEAENLEQHGGPKSPNNYNEINSPGKDKQ